MNRSEFALRRRETPAIRTWAQRHKVELCLTPTTASWANQIQAQFGPARQTYLRCATPPTGIQTYWPRNGGNALRSVANVIADGALSPEPCDQPSDR
jgi:hypothetical protein